jgi:hypothetical protein
MASDLIYAKIKIFMAEKMLRNIDLFKMLSNTKATHANKERDRERDR